MDKPGIEDRMYGEAVALITRRYPKGWGGAAVLRTADDTYLTSVAIETADGGASLCIETGAICEAHKLNKRVTPIVFAWCVKTSITPSWCCPLRNLPGATALLGC